MKKYMKKYMKKDIEKGMKPDTKPYSQYLFIGNRLDLSVLQYSLASKHNS